MNEFVGFNTIANLPRCLAQFTGQKILLVHGKQSYAACGAKAAITPLLQGWDVLEWSDFANNPQWDDMQTGLKLFDQHAIVAIVAVGGGSVLDTAKLLSIFAHNRLPLERALAQGFTAEAIPLIAVPTTAGTGSEATQFAVLWTQGQKFSIDTPKLIPYAVIVDPAFLKNQSAASAAAPLLDALAQAVESYWCVNSTDESKAFAKQAIELIVPTITAAQPGDQEYLDRAMGAHLGGKAINITRTTAAHAVSYAFTAYRGLAHGHAVMLTLAAFFRYNYAVSAEDCQDKRGPAYVRETLDELVALLGCADIDQAMDKLNSFMDFVGLERNLAKLGVSTAADFQYIINNGFNPQRVKNNPRRLTAAGLLDMLENL